MKAFPLKAVNKFDDSEGMDLRDYFAAQAMNQIGWHGDVDSLVACAKECYMIADAMMEVREDES
jgi:hypothetical protein